MQILSIDVIFHLDLNGQSLNPILYVHRMAGKPCIDFEKLYSKILWSKDNLISFLPY
jgi:hypothetical protein